jgi:D-inositol-3-phosphate glycosyltransferase
MKIVILGPAHPYRGGPATFNDRLAKQFSDEGHDVIIITFKLQYPGFLFPGKTQYTDSQAPEGIVIRKLVNSVNPFNWLSSGRAIRKIRPELMIVRYWLPFMAPSFGTISRIVRSNRFTKIVCIFDNVIPHEKRPGDKSLTKYFTSSIDGAIVMSGTVRADLKRFRDNMPVVLSPHPLFDGYGDLLSKEAAANILGLDKDLSYILFFGFIRAYKGLDLLIEALGKEKLKKLGLKLIVAGEFYENSAPYIDLVRKNHLDDDIIFFNRFIRDDEVPAVFGLADLVVQPYRSATQSGVTQIAFHYEKPMLVTDVGGLSEIVKDGKCGYVTKPDADSIASAILDYFEKDRKALFTEGVKKEKLKFGWDKMTGSILNVYNNI